jgi:PEGA domain.
MAAFVIPLIAEAKSVKISVIPSDAKIFVDGNYVSDGITTASFGTKDEFLVVKMEREGYVTLETKVYKKDKRKAVSYTMKRDLFYDGSVMSGSANRFFSQEISEDYVKQAKNEKEASILAWKMIHQVILNYFDEIESSDQLSGFIQTPWAYKTFADANVQVRTRVTVKESNIGGKLTYQMKITSEVAPMNANRYRDESFRETTRVLKEFEPIISEFQTRLGKL